MDKQIKNLFRDKSCEAMPFAVCARQYISFSAAESINFTNYIDINIE